MKLLRTFALLVAASIAGVVPQAHATAANVQLWIAGSSALWQGMAYAAYNNGHNLNAHPVNSTYTVTCHWTTGTGGAASFNLIDTRLSKNLTDSGQTWVVWSIPNTSTCATQAADNPVVGDVWVFSNVDSVVGNHAYFAKMTMNSSYAVGSAPIAGANAIGSALFSDNSSDTTPSQNLWNFLAAGAIVNVAATDIRPEDAAWVMCRVNSPLGSSTASGGLGDGLDGLGYNTTGAAQGSGECAKYNASSTQALKNVFGNAVLSGYPVSSGKKANVAAFNISGKDPATNATVPAYTVYPIGAVPIVFIVNQHNHVLSGLNNATDRQLQTAFSGTNCNASAFGLSSGVINVFLREPLSGTYNTTEANVMRYPTIYPTSPGVTGTSQETGVGAATLSATPCAAGGGLRYRAIGTGEEVKSVLKSSSSDFGANAADGIGYTFFSYGNVSSIAAQSDYNYISVNGIDPIFQSYNGGSGAGVDPGQPSTGQLPLNTPCGTGASAFPCAEQKIWNGGYSFPNVRNGTYRAWSLLRLVSTSTAGTNAALLAAAAESYSANEVPDFVPIKPVKNGTVVVDPGLLILRSHYLQIGGDGSGIGHACTGVGTTTGCTFPANVVESQSDMGGVIIPTNQGGVKSTATVTPSLNGVSFPNGTGVDEIRNVTGSAADGTLGSHVRAN